MEHVKKAMGRWLAIDQGKMQSFCQEFAVELKLVKSYILHLQDLRIHDDLRERGRDEQ